ncbi:MAG: serine hydrolase [Vicingaceae bacterium]
MKITRFLFRFVVAFAIAVGIICLGLWLSGNAHLIKAVRSTYLVGKTGPTINDYHKFENRIVATANTEYWPKSSNYNSQKLTEDQQQILDDWETSAFLIIKDSKLLYESYAKGFDSNSLTNSFSMAKSLTSLAIGAAIKEGKIEGVKQKVGDFLPEFREGKKAEITIRDLLTMSSGIDFGESYGDPFGYMAKTYYGTNLYDLTVNKSIIHPAGQVWKYQGGNTLLLSFILKEATGENLSDYFSTHFWKPMGANKDALWSISEAEGRERAYCCFYSNAQDFARIGQLVLDSGVWNNEQLISKEYFNASFHPVNIKDEKGKLIDYYAYQWWLGDLEGDAFYYARGIQGQYIVAIPSWNLVLVRLGHKRDPTRGVEVPSDLIDYLKIAKQF